MLEDRQTLWFIQVT